MKILKSGNSVFLAALMLFIFPVLVDAQTYVPVIKSGHIKPPGSIQETSFFPFSVWYSGGKARAPMVPEVGPNAKKMAEGSAAD